MLSPHSPAKSMQKPPKLSSYVVHSIPSLVTCEPFATSEKPNPTSIEDLGIIRNAWLSITGGKIVAYGKGQPAQTYAELPHIKAQGKLWLPGLIDAHTHVLFAGSRSHEFCRRAGGATYQEIAKSGGGIQSTVKHTRAASDRELLDLAQQRLRRMLESGTTCAEVKTGYGLSVEHERRFLKIYQQLKQSTPVGLSVTCLALHAQPAELSKQAYIDQVTKELLPAVASKNLCDSVDAFVEKGYFEPHEVDAFFKKAAELKIPIRIHADEFCDSGAASAAARWGALSADHLQFADPAGLAAMSRNNVVGTLLPGTSLYTQIPYTDAQKLLKAGVRVCLASDFNPGSSKILNLGLILSLGCLYSRLSPEQCIAAVTHNAAISLNMANSRGSVQQGFDANFTVYNFDSIYQLVADMGQSRPEQVIIDGNALI